MSTENLRESIVNKLWADTELHHEDAGPIADAVLDLVAARLSEVEAERDAAKFEEESWYAAAHQREEETWKAEAERDQLRAELEAWRPVVEAAIAYENRWRRYAGIHPGADSIEVRVAKAKAHQALLDATRNVDSTTPGATDG